MTVSVDTLISRSIKNMGAVHPQIKERAIELIRRSYNEGIRVQISSGYRSNAEQQKLYNQGRTTPGNIVTNAKPGQSIHNYGLAIDYFLVSSDGLTALWTVNAQWRRVAAIAKTMGFEWGGDWKGFVDYPHLQYTGGLTIAQLQSGKRPTIPDIAKTATVDDKKKKEEAAKLEEIKKINEELTKLKKEIADLKKFNDVNGPVSDWAKDDWAEIKVNGYMDGTSPRRFVRREELAKVINTVRHNFLPLIKGEEKEEE